MSEMSEMSLSEARAWLRERWESTEGVECPCCDRRITVYKTPYPATAARMIVLLRRRFAPGEFVHVPTVYPDGGGDYAKARHWGHIEPQGGMRDDGSTRTGWWRLTREGWAIANGEKEFPKYGYISLGDCLGFDGPNVLVGDRTGKKFRYDELMGWVNTDAG